MGLAEPRKRLKIAHDPNNLAWSQSTDSYGQRLMLSQGWKAGEGLGARNSKPSRSHDSSRVAVTYKDDMLGLGAKLTSKNVEQSRAGLDAFQGLLGRLNGKNDVELKKEEQKVEDRKLAMWAQGKWGGMTFVPGGLLVQRDAFQKNEEQEDLSEPSESSTQAESEAAAKARRKEEKRERKAEKQEQPGEIDEAVARRKRKEERRKKRTEKGQPKSKGAKDEPEEEADSGTEISVSQDETKKRKKKSKANREADRHISLLPENPPEAIQIPTPPEEPTRAPTIIAPSRNGRHLLRGKNIQAKRMAFGDAKMLDEIFMRKT